MPNTAFREPLSYLSIFPDTEFNDIGEAYSLHGPGAYLVWLLNIALDKKFAGNNDALALLRRRPDLVTLPITEKNTNTEYPYLRSVVNNALNFLVTANVVPPKPYGTLPVWGAIPYDHSFWLAASLGANSFIPYNRPAAGIDAALHTLGSSLNNLSVAFSKDAWSDRDWVYSELGLTSLDVAVLQKPGTTLSYWTTPPDTITPATLRSYTGLEQETLLALLYNGLDPDDPQDRKTLYTLFINADKTGQPLLLSPQDDTAPFANMSTERLQRIRVFLLLANATGWDFSTLYAALTGLGITSFTPPPPPNDTPPQPQLQQLAAMHFISRTLDKDLRGLFPAANTVNKQAFTERVPVRTAPSPALNNGLSMLRKTALIRTLGHLTDKKTLVFLAAGTGMTREQLDSLLYIAGGLGVSPLVLRSYLNTAKIAALDLRGLFDLCRLQQDLTAVGSSIAEYMPAFIESLDTDRKFVAFDQWLTQLQQSSDALRHSYSKDSDAAQLEKLVFQHWVHELGVYWGESADLISRVFLGFLSGAKDPGYATLNAFFALPDPQKPGIPPPVRPFLETWLPHIVTASRLNFPGDVLYLFGTTLKNDDSQTSPLEYSVDTLRALLQLQKTWSAILPEKRSAFLAMIATGDIEKKTLLSGMTAVSTWGETDMTTLLDHWGMTEFKNVAGFLAAIGRLSDCFGIVNSTAQPVDALLAALAVVSGDNFLASAGAAAALESSLADRSRKDRSLSVANGVSQARLLGKDRDILIPAVTWSLYHSFQDIDNADAVSDFFLNDVSMSGSMTITPVREAMDAVQTFLVRCKNAMEDLREEVFGKIDATTWDFIENFRLWEADQRLIQYPQNYFQPETRPDATDLFSDLKDRLQRQDVGDSSAMDAIRHYIHAWLQLTDKTVVDAIYYHRDSDNANILCFLARSNSDPQTYYYMETQRTQNPDNKRFFLEYFTQWEEVDVRIPAATASIVYAFNRYFIFYSEFSHKTDSDPFSSANRKYTLHSITVRYIQQDSKGGWHAARQWDSFPFYLETEDPQSPLKRWTGPITAMLWPNNSWWQKPVAVMVGDSLYVWLSPLANGRTYDPTKSFQGAQTVSPEFDAFCTRIQDFVKAQSYVWLSPKKMDVNGLISDVQETIGYGEGVTPPKNATSFLYLVGGNAINTMTGFTFADILLTSLGGPSDVVTTIKTVAYNLINPPAAEKQTAPPWQITSLATVRGMQAAIFSTNIGVMFIGAENTATPMSFKLDDKYNMVISGDSPCDRFFLHNLTSLFPQLYGRVLRKDGLPAALSLDKQTAPLDPNPSYATTNYRSGAKLDNWYTANMTQAEFFGAGGKYTWELFFYTPALVARCLNANLRYEEAAKWYRYLFNPFGHVTPPKTGPDVWKFAPFNNAGLLSYTLATRKWTVEQYISNILDWGDNEFRQETWESLAVADQLYEEAARLLGDAPRVVNRTTAFAALPRTYNDISKGKLTDYFGWPTDQVLQGYWTRVADRRYKLRHGLNIDGQVQTPSDYGSPIDPGRLKLALQNGGINPYDLSAFTTPKTVYRFRELLPATESIIETTVQFGSQLNSALQQKDSAQLQQLQATHQLDMETFIVRNFQTQIDEAQAEIDALGASLESALMQQTHYKTLLQAGLNPSETSSLATNEAAMGVQSAAAVLRQVAMINHLIPTIYGLADGGFQPGSAMDSQAGVLSETGSVLMTSSQMLGMQASFDRREEEWDLAATEAGFQVTQLQTNITAAHIRLLMAQSNLGQHQLSAAQSLEVQTYLSARFSNADLYTWMTGQLSSLYFKSYQLALNALHRLQTAYAYEVDDDTNFIPAGSWDGLRQGLLAGESLKLAAARMKDAYMVGNIRLQEIEYILSLKQLASKAIKPGSPVWSDFFPTDDKKTPNPAPFPFSLSLTGLGHDQDKRTCRIRSLSISIPAVIGPYEVFNGTLQYVHTSEQITISRGIDDRGIFVEDMGDGRYLPFEGLPIPQNDPQDNDDTGRWQVQIPQDLRSRISDIILTIKYTAK